MHENKQSIWTDHLQNEIENTKTSLNDWFNRLYNDSKIKSKKKADFNDRNSKNQLNSFHTYNQNKDHLSNLKTYWTTSKNNKCSKLILIKVYIKLQI